MRTGHAGAIDIYVENNRVAAMPSDGDAVATAVAMWDRYEAEGETFAVFSTCNETARDLNAAIQRLRGQNGLVSGKGIPQGRHHKLGVGDHVVTRQNDRGLVTDRGHWVRNRETFTITKIRKTSIPEELRLDFDADRSVAESSRLVGFDEAVQTMQHPASPKLQILKPIGTKVAGMPATGPDLVRRRSTSEIRCGRTRDGRTSRRLDGSPL